MRIVHVAESDVAGGAAVAARRLHKGLQKLGHESLMVGESRSTGDPSVGALQKPMNVVSLAGQGICADADGERLWAVCGVRPGGYELFSGERRLQSHQPRMEA
jgi:hypothetical protein